MDLSEGRELGLGVGRAPSTSLLPPSSQSTPLGDHPLPTLQFSEVRDIPPLRMISPILPVNSKQTATGDLDSFRIPPAPQLLHISPSKSFFTVIPSSHFSSSPFNLPSCAGPKTGGGEETWEGESCVSNLPYGFCPIIHKRGNEPGPKAIH